MEIWKDIYFIENNVEYDYRDYYQVSSKGNVRKIGKENKILKKTKTQNGYLHVSLYKDKKIKKFYIHRLVAHMFLSELFFTGASINHIDENKENNHVSNFEWCTEKYNANYGKRNDKIGSIHTGKKTSTKTKEKMSKSMNWKLIARFDLNMNLIDIKRQFEFVEMGFNKYSISECCRKNKKRHKILFLNIFQIYQMNKLMIILLRISRYIFDKKRRILVSIYFILNIL